MELVVAAFLAGLLTVLAPCVLPVVPVIVGGSIYGGEKSYKRAAIIVASLGVSIIVFTLLLKATTALLGVPQLVWQIISAAILILLGVSFVFPALWDKISLGTGAALGSQQLFAKANSRGGILGPILTGAALGPVFSSCSPTYAFIVAAVLPVSFAVGFLYLVLYTLGLSLILFVVAYFGQRLIHKLGWALNPHGWFRRSIGVLFIIIGIAVLVGVDKALQTAILENGLYAPIEQLEMQLQ